MVFFLCILSVSGQTQVQFNQKFAQANEGHLLIQWQNSSGPVELKKTSGNSSLSLYKGKDSAYYISGLEEGDHQFEVIDDQGNLDQMNVQVQYPSSKMVWGSLIIGSLLFLTLCWIIIGGNRKYGKLSS